MAYAYATQDLKENMAKAVRISLPISTKVSIEIAKKIKGMAPKDAITLLETVLAKTAAMPYTQFNDNVAHRRGGIGPGRYPEKASQEYIALIKSVVANAIHQSLDENKLIIHSIVVQKGSKTYKYSRVRGLKSKNTHIEMVVAQVEPQAPKPRTPRNHNAEKKAASAKARAAQ